MHPYQPVSYRHPALRQAAAAPAPVSAPVVSDSTKKVVTGVITLAVLGSATWAGFSMGSRSKGWKKAAGYVGGVGAALLGAAVVGNAISLPPAVNTAFSSPFNLQVA